MFTPRYNITEWFSVKAASKEIQGPSEKGSGLCARKSTMAQDVLERAHVGSYGGRLLAPDL